MLEGDALEAAGEGPLLYYAAACPLCLFLSRAVVLLSLGTVSRAPLERAAANTFYYQDHPQAGGKPVLFHGGRVILGRRVFLAIPRVIAGVWLGRLGLRRAAARGAHQEEAQCKAR